MTKPLVNIPRNNTASKVSLELRQIHALRCWQEKLQAVESVFARLVFVSRLRDASGRYVDSYLSRVYSPKTCHQIVSDVHLQIFRHWLQISAKAKLSDLRRYHVTTCAQGLATDRTWSQLCRELIPSGISITELTFFSETVNKLRSIVVGPPNEHATVTHSLGQNPVFDT